MRYLVSFDIADDRRRRRATRLLEGHGTRMQESVYRLELRESQWQRLAMLLDAAIDARDDQWRGWPLCRRDLADASQLGIAPPPVSESAVIV